MTPGQARVALGGFFLLAIGVTSNALYLQGAVGGVEKAASVRTEPPAKPPKAAKAAAKPAKTAKTPERAAAKPPERVAAAARPPEQPERVAAAARPPEPPKEPPSEPEASAAGQPKSVQTVKVRMVRVATVGEAPPEAADADTVRSVQEQLNRQGYGPVPTDGVMGMPTRAAIVGYEQDHGMALTGEASQALLKELLFGTPPASGAPDAPEVRTPHAQTLIKQVQEHLAARGYHPGPADGRLSAATVAALRTFETDQGLVPKGRISAVVVERLQTGIGGGGRHPK